MEKALVEKEREHYNLLYQQAEEEMEKLTDLLKENKELKASLDVYKRQEEVTKMNALIEEFSYCFAADEKAELVKDLEHKTFAEVENIVNENVRKFAKENKPDDEEEKKDSSDMMFETKTEYEDVEDLEPMEEIPMEEKLEELTHKDENEEEKEEVPAA